MPQGLAPIAIIQINRMKLTGKSQKSFDGGGFLPSVRHRHTARSGS
jgi:hypothetical protein